MNNEQELIRRAQRGDGEAFRRLVEAYQTQVYRLALRMCGESAADDVTQEAFLAAWRALPDFRGDCRFSTWLYRLTTNAGIDWLRREKRHRSTDDVTELELPDDAPSPQEQAEQAETQSAVRRALSCLAASPMRFSCMSQVSLSGTADVTVSSVRPSSTAVFAAAMSLIASCRERLFSARGMAAAATTRQAAAEIIHLR